MLYEQTACSEMDIAMFDAAVQLTLPVICAHAPNER